MGDDHVGEHGIRWKPRPLGTFRDTEPVTWVQSAGNPGWMRPPGGDARVPGVVAG